MNRNQSQPERSRRKRGEKPMKKEREHPLVVILAIIHWLGYGGMKDLYSLLSPFIAEDPVRSASILLNVILLSLLFQKRKKTRRQTSL